MWRWNYCNIRRLLVSLLTLYGHDVDWENYLNILTECKQRYSCIRFCKNILSSKPDTLTHSELQRNGNYYYLHGVRIEFSVFFAIVFAYFYTVYSHGNFKSICMVAGMCTPSHDWSSPRDVHTDYAHFLPPVLLFRSRYTLSCFFSLIKVHGIYSFIAISLKKIIVAEFVEN